jgi:hypothetical protein
MQNFANSEEYNEGCPEVVKRDTHFGSFQKDDRMNRRRSRNDKGRNRKQRSHKFQKKEIIASDFTFQIADHERELYVRWMYKCFEGGMSDYGADDEFLGLSKAWWESYRVFFHNEENTIKVFLDGPWQTMFDAWACPDFDRDMAVLEGEEEDLLSLPPRRHTHSNGFSCQCSPLRRRFTRPQR